MPVEIERKFLVKGDFKQFAIKKYKIEQGFLSKVPERTVRIRIQDKQGFITVKGIGNTSGTTRFEWEKEIKFSDAKALLKLCETGVIKKWRYIIPAGNDLVFEVDDFLGENKGLKIAEIELSNEQTEFNIPSWLGEEVTGIKKYYNSTLIENPFSCW